MRRCLKLNNSRSRNVNLQKPYQLDELCLEEDIEMWRLELMKDVIAQWPEKLGKRKMEIFK